MQWVLKVLLPARYGRTDNRPVSDEQYVIDEYNKLKTRLREAALA
nr:hypothetical protein [Escherichia coli]